MNIDPQVAAFMTNERPFATIESYWRDPAPFEAEEAAMRAKAHAAIDAAIQRNRKGETL